MNCATGRSSEHSPTPDNPATLPSDDISGVVSGTAKVLVATGFGLGLNFFYTIGLARFLGPEHFGLFAIGLAVFSIVSILSTAGLDSAALRFLPALLSAGASTSVWPTVRILLLFALGGGVFLGGGLYVVRDILATAFFHDHRLAEVFLWFAVAVPLFALSSTLVAVLQAMHIVTWRLVVKYVCEPMAKAILTGMLLWAGWGLPGALIGFGVALAVTTVLAFLPIRHFWTEEQAQSGVQPYRLLGYSVPLVLALLFASLGNRSDILLLGYYVPSAQVGIYGAAFQAASILALVLQSFESIVQPFFSQRIAQADQAGLNRVYHDMLRWVGMTVLPLFLLMSLCAEPLLSLYGREYEAGAWCLIVLALAQCINSVTAPAHGLLVLSGHSRLVMWNSLIVAVVQIALNALLIPRYGMIGAAVATGLSLTGVNVARVVEAFVLLRVPPLESGMWKPLAAGFLSLLMALGLRAWFQTEHLVAVSFSFILTYAVALHAMGLHEDDRRVFVTLAGRLRMGKKLLFNV